MTAIFQLAFAFDSISVLRKDCCQQCLSRSDCDDRIAWQCALLELRRLGSSAPVDIWQQVLNGLDIHHQQSDKNKIVDVPFWRHFVDSPMDYMRWRWSAIRLLTTAAFPGVRSKLVEYCEDQFHSIPILPPDCDLEDSRSRQAATLYLMTEMLNIIVVPN